MALQMLGELKYFHNHWEIVDSFLEDHEKEIKPGLIEDNPYLPEVRLYYQDHNFQHY